MEEVGKVCMLKQKKINIVLTTQGSNLQAFTQIVRIIQKRYNLFNKIGIITSFYRNFKSLPANYFKGLNVKFIKEWEIVKDALSSKYYNSSKVDMSYSNFFWNSIIGDRRLIYGPLAKFSQDYRVKFSHEDLISIFNLYTERYEKFLKDIKPNLLLGFVPVTFGELLAISISKKNKIPALQFHSSRISNYFALHNKVIGTSTHFIEHKNENKFNEKIKTKAKKIIHEIRNSGIIYEGVNLKKKAKIKLNIVKALRNLPQAMIGEVLKFFDKNSRLDNHDPGFLKFWVYSSFIWYFKEKKVNSFLKSKNRIVNASELSKIQPFCFFPLHSEPEVSLQVLAKPYHKNQIELIRNLACSLPINMKIVVKEHPRSIGNRNLKFYETLLQIPNLIFVDPLVDTKFIIEKSKFSAIITSTIGLESLILKKPILVLGFPKYGELFEDYIIRCYNLFELPKKIDCLLKLKKINENNIIKSVCALIKGSVAINFYNKILKKNDRYLVENDLSEEEEINILSKYCFNRINEELINK